MCDRKVLCAYIEYYVILPYVLCCALFLCDLCHAELYRPDQRVQRFMRPEGPQPDRTGGSNELDRTRGSNELRALSGELLHVVFWGTH